MTEEGYDYYADRTRINKSGLDLINKTPFHYYHKILSDYKEIIDKPSLKVGRAVHSAILEPHNFANDFAVASTLGNYKKNQDAIQKFNVLNSGKTILSQEHFDQCRRMSDAMWKHSFARELLTGGKSEAVIHWNDWRDNVPCKAKADKLSKQKFICDIKTAEDASPEAFGYAVKKYRLHVQSAFYVDGYMQMNQEPPEGFIFIVIEKNPPYLIAIYVTPEYVYERGVEDYTRNLKTYHECSTKNDWPAYLPEATYIEVPSFKFKKP